MPGHASPAQAPLRKLAAGSQVGVGAGIGITPFLGMLRFETVNDDSRRVWLWYLARDAAHAPYDAEIRETVPKAESWIDYELWTTADRGRLTAARVLETVRPLDDGIAVMLCGTPGNRYTARAGCFKDAAYAFLDVTSKGGLALYCAMRATWQR